MLMMLKVALFGCGDVMFINVFMCVFIVDLEYLVCYAYVCGYRLGDALLLVYLYVLVFLLHLQLLVNSLFSVVGVVHVVNWIV